ncbi:MAG: T9SS C-terminal target domain-containing protein, partial [Ignavibacteriae bacterium]|nr:T9SS C-terminal target domain-containing protein [Ignavibacteriota bacterium]
EMKEPGTYEAEWDANGMASGVYFYKLVAGSYRSTKKMLLTR